jgi:hypothetical protein
VLFAARLLFYADDGLKTAQYHSGPFARWDPAWFSLHGIEPSLMLAAPCKGQWILKHATGSTDLANDWNPTATSGHLHYSRMLAAISELGMSVDAVIWIQGEQDALDAGKAAAYEANLRAFCNACRADLGSATYVVIVKLHDSSTRTYKTTIQAAQAAVAAENAYNVLVDPSSISDYDGLHYGGDGYIELGDDIATALAAL